ncbi:MAG: hypothetical protein HY537_04970 [Deltaproteobacteria bacterium]|nr:hypothetical protein [Deltaproteobacteria bacterium]
MRASKKYTVELEEALVKSAVRSTGKSFTETVRQGLKILASTEAYRELSKMRGTVDLQLDIREIRKNKRDQR